MKKEKVLKKYFGHKKFRDGQSEIIDNILEGNDILGIMPTGAGKSIYFFRLHMLLLFYRKR